MATLSAYSYISQQYPLGIYPSGKGNHFLEDTNKRGRCKPCLKPPPTYNRPISKTNSFEQLFETR